MTRRGSERLRAMFVELRLVQVRPRGAHRDGAIFHAAHGDELVGYFLRAGRLASGNDDLQAVVVIQVDVRSGNNVVMVAVLYGREPILQLALVMVVDDRNDGDDLLVRFNLFLNQRSSNEVAHRL